MLRNVVDIALTTGDIIEDLPISLIDKEAYQKTAKARGWKDDDILTQNKFLAWYVAKRLGRLDITYEDFGGICEDIAVRTVDARSITGADPTQKDR